MRLGIDFDNTLVSYDHLFRRVALEQASIPESTAPSKNAVRDYLRAAGREDEWTRLQGRVYGARIAEAEPYEGMLAALQLLSQRAVAMCVVSHKTRTPYLGEPCDLHAAARGWLEQQGFHDPEGLGWPRSAVFFELSQEAKIARILSQGCTHYVDDLPQILAQLPDHVQKIHFSPHAAAGAGAGAEADAGARGWRVMRAWRELPALLSLA